MAFSPGDTFLIKASEPWDERFHLYIVLTNPEQSTDGLMLLPCIETKRDYHRDFSCILREGDHPFIRHESVINYRDVITMDSAGLQTLIEIKNAKPREPLTPDVYERVLEGARRSPLLDRSKKRMLPDRTEPE